VCPLNYRKYREHFILKSSIICTSTIRAFKYGKLKRPGNVTIEDFRYAYKSLVEILHGRKQFDET
jgi:hypothetical protein